MAKCDFDLENFLRHYKPKISPIVGDILRKNDLSDYTYVNDVTILAPGGYIKYANMDGDIVGYGVYVSNSTKNKIILKNTSWNKIWKIDPSKYFLFYKEHVAPQNKIRQMMLKLLDDLS